MQPWETKGKRLNIIAIVVGAAIIVAGYEFIYENVRATTEDEYVAPYYVVLVGLLLPAFVGGLASALIARHKHQVHAALSVVLIFALGALARLLIQLGVFDGALKLSVLVVFGTAWMIGAPLGGYVASRYAERERRSHLTEQHAIIAAEGDVLLEVDDLTMHYKTTQGWVSAVDDVSFVLHQGEALGLVGESGCGKTSVAMSLLRLIAENGRFKKGSIRLNGVDLLQLTPDEMRARRWADISMVFQGAMNAWNPVYTVHDQIREAMDLHLPQGLSDAEVRERIGGLFELVGLNPAMMDRYPHEFSGGMRQRAVIAMALSCNPQIIIADEPTTALDVIVQDQILDELKKIQSELGMSIIYISHDIAVIAEVTDKMGVMYAGRLVEYGSTDTVFASPRHPYSYLLLKSTPSITGPRRKLAPLDGEPPNLLDPPTGCRFHPRCPFATEQCEKEEPVLDSIGQGDHTVACWNWREVPVELTEAARP